MEIDLIKKENNLILQDIAASCASLMVFFASLQEISYYWKFSITGYRVFLIPTFLAMGVLYWRKEIKPAPTNLILPMFFFLLACLFSVFGAVNFEQSLRLIFILIFSFLGFFIVIWLSKNERWFLWLINAYLMGGIASALYGFFQLVAVEVGWETIPSFLKDLPASNPVLRAPHYKSGLIGTRIDAFLGDPNFLAGFMLASFFLAIAMSIYWQRSGKKRLSWLYLFGAEIYLAAFLLTYSRSGFLGLLVSLFAFLFFGRRYFNRHFMVKSAMVILVTVLLVCLLSLPLGLTKAIEDKAKAAFAFNWQRLTQTFGTEYGSTEHHLVTGLAGFKMFAQSPLLGVGIGNYGEFYGRYVRKGLVKEASHSSYVQFFAEGGILGGLGLLWILTAFLLTLFRSFKRLTTKDPKGALILGIFAGSIGYFVANIFYFYITHEYVWLYLGLGMATATIWPEKGINS